MSLNSKTSRRLAHLSCAALALSLNAVFAWAAVEATATVPPLRTWQAAAPLAGPAAGGAAAEVMSARLAALTADGTSPAALVH